MTSLISTYLFTAETAFINDFILPISYLPSLFHILALCFELSWTVMHTHTHRQMHTCIRPQRFISMICLLQSINLPSPLPPFHSLNTTTYYYPPTAQLSSSHFHFAVCVCVYIVEVVVVFILRNNKILLNPRIFYFIFIELIIGFLNLEIVKKKAQAFWTMMCVCLYYLLNGWINWNMIFREKSYSTQ